MDPNGFLVAAGGGLDAHLSRALAPREIQWRLLRHHRPHGSVRGATEPSALRTYLRRSAHAT